MSQSIHLISFDIPYPADYGGAIDVYYKVRALKNAGCKVYLHCYAYGRKEAPELEQYCEQVWYYPRITGAKGFSLSLPYIVSSRKSELLLQRLKETDAPILMEGMHTSYFLSHAALAGRFKALRIHNIEYDYYKLMSHKEPSIFKKTYFKTEARLLRKYEHKLEPAQAFFALSQEDYNYFKVLYPHATHAFIPPFHQYDSVSSLEGSGDYCLYHGNLSHPENREAALFLLKKVFPFVKARLILAGKNPTKDIVAACKKLDNCELITNPDSSKMDDLVTHAHIHVLPTFQQSGMKLKLLTSLFGGRHVLVNTPMLHGTGLHAENCNIANSDADFIKAINVLMAQPFTSEAIEQRRNALMIYDNNVNARKLLEYFK